MFETALRGLADHEKLVRLCSFFGVFILMAFWEFLASRRKEKVPRVLRWPNNLALAFLNTFILRLLFPSATMGAAYWAVHLQFGLFQWVQVPPAFSVLFTVVVMDCVIYYQHRAFHASPFFWKFHRMHHTDLEMDVTTGTRFHTLEMIFSMLFKSAFILMLGAPVAGAFLLEVVLNATSMFSHSNVRMPSWLDAVLRVFIVTPDMHRIHHSVISVETNSNFGFNLSIWDRLLGTYRPNPMEGQEKMKIGLDIFNDPKYLTVDKMLQQPFLDKKGSFAFKHLTSES